MNEPPIERLHVGYFADEGHRLIFLAMRALRAKHQPIAAGLQSELRERGWLERSGGAAIIARIVNSVTHHHEWRFYAEQVEQLAVKRELYEIGSETAAAACNGRTVGEIVESLSERLHNLQDRVLAHGEIELLTAAQLAQGEFTVSYLVEGMLVKGQPAIVAGPQKSLKTSISLDLALSLASGTSFLGTWKAFATRVLMLSGESGLATLQETALRVCQHKGIVLADISGFHMGTWIPRFNDVQELTKLKRVLDRSQAEVLFIDPAYLAIPGDDAGNMFKMGESLRRVSDLAQECSVTLILVHHTRKGVETGAMPELSWIAWSGFGEYARQWLLLNRRNPYQPGSGEHRLWLSAGGSAGHGGAWAIDVLEGTTANHGRRNWDLTVRDAAVVAVESQVQRQLARQERRDAARRTSDEQIRKKVVDILGDGPRTRNSIKGALRRNGKIVCAAVDALLESRDLEICRVETNGGTYDGVKLRSDKVGLSEIVRPGPG